MRNWLERAWSSNKWKTILLGFISGIVIGIFIYYMEKVWIKMHVVKPFNMTPFYLLPYWRYKKFRDKFLAFLNHFRKDKSVKKAPQSSVV
jgi:hypothetical protein